MVVAGEIDCGQSTCINQGKVDYLVVFLIAIIRDGKCVVLRGNSAYGCACECQCLWVSGTAVVCVSGCVARSCSTKQVIDLDGYVRIQRSRASNTVGCEKQSDANIVHATGNRLVH